METIPTLTGSWRMWREGGREEGKEWGEDMIRRGISWQEGGHQWSGSQVQVPRAWCWGGSGHIPWQKSNECMLALSWLSHLPAELFSPGKVSLTVKMGLSTYVSSRWSLSGVLPGRPYFTSSFAGVLSATDHLSIMVILSYFKEHVLNLNIVSNFHI